MSIKWTDYDNDIFFSLLDHAVDVSSIQEKLPLRSIGSISKKALRNGYRTQTVDGVQKQVKGVKRRNRVAKIKINEANTEIGTKQADETINTSNNDISAQVECLDNKSTESIPSLHLKANKEYKLENKYTIITPKFKFDKGSGYSTAHKKVYKIMIDLEDDIRGHFADSYMILHNDFDVSDHNLDLFGEIGYAFVEKIEEFIDENQKYLHDINKADLDIYLQPFFNFILESIDALTLPYELDFEYREILRFIFKVLLYEWVITQRRSHYIHITRLRVSSLDNEINEIRSLHKLYSDKNRSTQ